MEKVTKVSIDITVRLACGDAYVARFGKTTASCTSGPEAAAQRLGRKVFGEAAITVQRIDPEPRDHVVQRWRIEAEPAAV